MRKLIIKTVSITVAILFAFLIIFYFALASFSPSILSNFYFRVNNANLTLKYSLKAYDKSGDIDDLAILCERSILFDNGDMLITYATILINQDDYLDFALDKGEDYNYYIVGSLVQALYQKGERSVATETAINNTGNYSSVNPIRIIISLSIENGDTLTLQTIKQHLLSLTNKNQLILHDISWIEVYSN